jgi:hypothetical protein
MNKDNAKNYLPLVQALADGKIIQFLTLQGVYVDSRNPDFSAPASDYRIKPEPMVVWLNEYPGQNIIYSDPHDTQSSADDAASPFRSRCVKFVECLEG